MQNYDYEIVCYRVMWFDTILNKWYDSDYSQEECAVNFLKDCIKSNVKCKLLKISCLVGDLDG